MCPIRIRCADALSRQAGVEDNRHAATTNQPGGQRGEKLRPDALLRFRGDNADEAAAPRQEPPGEVVHVIAESLGGLHHLLAGFRSNACPIREGPRHGGTGHAGELGHLQCARETPR
jgi:hypothetical protein